MWSTSQQSSITSCSPLRVVQLIGFLHKSVAVLSLSVPLEKYEDQRSCEKKNVAVKFYVPYPVAGSALDLQPWLLLLPCFVQRDNRVHH